MYVLPAPSVRMYACRPLASYRALPYVASRRHAIQHRSTRSLCGCGRPLLSQQNFRIPASHNPRPGWEHQLRSVLCHAKPQRFDSSDLYWELFDIAEMDTDSMKLHQLKAELKARRQTLGGNKAELQAKLEGARQTQGDLKAFIKQSDEEDWWSDVTESEPLPPGPGNTPEERLYKMFRLEQRRQQLPQDGDQQKLYQMVEEEQQHISPAASAQQQAIAAYAQSGLDFDASELQDVIARFQAGDKSKVVRSARKAPGRGQTSIGQEAGGLDDHEQAGGQEEAEDPAEPQDLSSYKASELKEELARLSLPTNGSRQQLEDRLMEHYQTAMQQDAQYEALSQQVENMSTTELQQQLQARGIDYQGMNKYQLEDTLWRYIQVEAGLLPAEDTGVLEDDFGEQLQFSTPDFEPQPPPKVQDPPIMVALLCGGPLHSQQWSVTSAQMYLQQLQTHNPREGFQGDESPPTEASHSSTDSSDPKSYNGSETGMSHSDSRLLGLPLQRRTNLTGIHFVPFFLNEDMQAMPITLAELHGKPAATLQFESELQQRELLTVQELSLQLKEAADVALSTVQGEAGGLVGAVLDEARVPYVGAPADAALTVANKFWTQHRLRELGFPVLPVCQLHCSNFVQRKDFEQEVTSEQQGASEQGVSEQQGVAEQQGTAKQQGFFEQQASEQQGTSGQQGMAEQQGTFEQQGAAEEPPHWREVLDLWMEAHSLTMDHDCFVVKPADETQGAGILLVNDFESLELHALSIFEQGVCQSVVVEPYQAAAECTEFSVTVIGTSKGPVALMPMEAQVFDYADDIFEADLDYEAYKARREGFDQRVIDVYLDAFRTEERIESAGGAGRVLISPFSSHQPAATHVRYHMPPRFSKEVVRGIRHAAAKAFQELGMQDIARIDGWVKVDRPEPLFEFEYEGDSEADSADSDSPEKDSAEEDSDSAEPHSDFAELESYSQKRPGSQQPITDSSGMVTYDHTPDAEQLSEVVEVLPDDVLEYNSSPISQWAVPVLPLDLQAETGDEFENPGSEYVQAESQLVKTESEEADSVSGSDEVDSISTDADEEDESSLLLADVSPQELCMHGSSTIYLTGVHANPVLEPTSTVFQQAADVGMSHCTLLRHVLSRACVRAGLPPIPPPIVQDVTETNLVPYVQVQQDGPEIDLNGAILRTAGAVYASPQNLMMPTPLGRIETMKEPKLQPMYASEDSQGYGYGVPGPAGGQFGQQWDEQQYPPMQPAYNYGNPDDLPQTYLSADGYPEEYVEEEEEKLVTKVWILMGGDGLQRQASIRSGLHAWLMLQNNPELQVEPFLLAPQGANLRERERRKELMRQRMVQIKLGVLEDDLPQQLQLSYIKNPPAPSRSLPNRIVWAVPHSLLLRGKAEDIQAACEMAHKPATVVDRLLSEFDRDSVTLRRDVHRELEYGEVEGAGLLWGPNPMEHPPIPRLMDVPSFAAEAKQEEAVLLNCVQSEVGDNGYLQSYLQQKEVQVLHTGSDVHATALCHDKIAMSEHLKTLEVYNISTIPKLRLPLPVLFAASCDVQDAENLFQHLRSSLRDTPELCIKPALGSWGVNKPLPCIANGSDLMVYGLALQDRWRSLPANLLTMAHPEIDLPPVNDRQLMVEPYIHTARLVSVPQEQGPPQIQWQGESRWIAISAALLGEVGQMQVLTPSIYVYPITPIDPEDGPDEAPSEDSSQEASEDFSEDPSQEALEAVSGDPSWDPNGDPTDDPSEDFSEDPEMLDLDQLDLADSAEPIVLTPPPTEFLPADIIAAAKQWMTMAADRLAIAGAAHIDAFVHADKGEIIIIDVHTVPDLSQESLLLQQALVEQPPVHPNDVLREIVELAQLPTSEAVYEDDEAQFDNQAGLEEDADLGDVELEEGGPEADVSYGQQNFQPTQERGQADMAGGGAGWSDDSFTDAALDDEAFEASGFDVVDQQA